MAINQTTETQVQTSAVLAYQLIVAAMAGAVIGLMAVAAPMLISMEEETIEPEPTLIEAVPASFPAQTITAERTLAMDQLPAGSEQQVMAGQMTALLTEAGVSQTDASTFANSSQLYAVAPWLNPAYGTPTEVLERMTDFINAYVARLSSREQLLFLTNEKQQQDIIKKFYVYKLGIPLSSLSIGSTSTTSTNTATTSTNAAIAPSDTTVDPLDVNSPLPPPPPPPPPPINCETNPSLCGGDNCMFRVGGACINVDIKTKLNFFRPEEVLIEVTGFSVSATIHF